MANSNKTSLDASQCVVGAYDGVEEATRVIIAAATEFGIELSADDGDSVLTRPSVSDSSQSIAQTPVTAPATVLLTVSNTDKFSKLQVFAESLAGVTAGGDIYVQASPDSAGGLWATLGSAISSPSSVGASASSVVDFIAKRVRIVSNSAPVGGNAQYKIIFKS